MFTRITVDPAQMDGVPCIRDLRIPVATVVGMMADGLADEEILAAFPDLEPEDLREALSYAEETDANVAVHQEIEDLPDLATARERISEPVRLLDDVLAESR